MSAALATPVDAFVAELDELESIFSVCKGNRSVAGHGYTYVPSEDGCLVSLWDAWTRFLRALVMSSTSGPIIGLSGASYTPVQVRTEAQVLSDLAANTRGNNFGIIQGEPKWNDPVRLTSIVSFLGLGNGAVITNAITSSSVILGAISVASPLEEIRKCRNYVAHKAPPTLRDVQSYSHSFTTLSDHLRRYRSGVETFSEWRDCLAALAEAAGQ